MGKRHRTNEQLWAIRRVSIRIYGRLKSLFHNHHWKRLVKCSQALEKFNWNENKAVEYLKKGEN